jgi:hypothetical protein
MAPDAKRRILVVESEGGIRLTDVRKFLAEIEDAYNRVLLLLTLLDGLPRLERKPGVPIFRSPLLEYSPLAILAGSEGKPVHFTKSSVASLIGRSQSLILSSVRLESPGNWKLLGVSDSLEVLRKYLNDRHERRKDKQYRLATDEEKRLLENELLRTKVLSEKVKVAKELGANEEDLSPLLGQLLFDPLDELATFQDRGLIADVKVVDPDEPKPDSIPTLDLNAPRKINLE